MSVQEINSQKQRLDDLFVKGTAIGDFESQGHWARYLCIVTSGYLAVATTEIYGAHATSCAHPRVARFVQRHLTTMLNPNMSKIIDIATRFDKEWGRELEAKTAGEIKDSIDSLVANRNQIAHGRSVALTLAQMKQYYLNAEKLISLMRSQAGV